MVSITSYKQARERMVQEQLRERSITNSHVLGTFLETPREVFVPEDLKDQAYKDIIV